MIPEILYEDEDILVCVKPPGLPTQSGRIGTPDMVSVLKNHLYRQGKRQISAQTSPVSNLNTSPYLAVIHRLDQPVEGLLVFAKTPAAARGLNIQLTTGGFGKHYRVLLTAIPPKPEGDLEDYLLRDKASNTSRVCPPDAPGAKKASLHYKIIETYDSCALAEITLRSGRHHQIRVQMAHLGCPIMGDLKYGPLLPPSSQLAEITRQRRLWLVACRLSFLHPRTNKPLKFQLNRLQSFADIAAGKMDIS